MGYILWKEEVGGPPSNQEAKDPRQRRRDLNLEGKANTPTKASRARKTILNRLESPLGF